MASSPYGSGLSWDALNLAATDRSSGSATVAARAAEAFVEISSSLSRDAIVDAARLLVQGQPVMAACIRLADSVLRGLAADGPPGALQAARRFAAMLDQEKVAVAEQLRRKLPRDGIVVTVSASSTVLEGLCGVPSLRVMCAVSDPGGEGHAAVAQLEAHGIDATLIPDGAVARHATRADAIVFGADVLGPEALLNKTGTLGAALGARAAGRQCMSVAGRSKLIGDDAWTKIAAAAERLSVEGIPAFEEVPAAFVTTFITDAGPMSARALRRAARSVKILPEICGWLD